MADTPPTAAEKAKREGYRGMKSLTRHLADELLRYADGKAHKLTGEASRSPGVNLIRRNFLTLSPADGLGFYRITEQGRAMLQPAGDTPPTADPRDDLWQPFSVTAKEALAQGQADVVIVAIDSMQARIDGLEARAVAAESQRDELGNELAQERAKPEGSFDQWARLQAAEAALAVAEREREEARAALAERDSAENGDESAVDVAPTPQPHRSRSANADTGDSRPNDEMLGYWRDGCDAFREQSIEWENRARKSEAAAAAAIDALRRLVELKDGPRDAHYEAEKQAAWDAARATVWAADYAPEVDARGPDQ